MLTDDLDDAVSQHDHDVSVKQLVVLLFELLTRLDQSFDLHDKISNLVGVDDELVIVGDAVEDHFQCHADDANFFPKTFDFRVIGKVAYSLLVAGELVVLKTLFRLSFDCFIATVSWAVQGAWNGFVHALLGGVVALATV